MNGRRSGCVFGQTRAHSDHRELPAARHLKRVKIAVAVPGIERLNGHRYQEIALSGVASAFASRRVADPINLMQRVRYVIRESGLFESPLAICLSKGWKPKEQEGYQYFYLFIHEPSLELNGYGQDSGSICRGCYDGHRSMSASDSMNFFPATFLIKSNRPQDGCQDHSWAMNPGQSLVQADGPTGFRSRNLGRADGIVSAHKIQVPRRRAKSKMGIAIGGTGALAAGADARNDRDGQRNGRYQP